MLRLGGALEVPDADLSAARPATQQTFETWDQPYPDPFQKALAAFVDLPDDYAAQTAAAANAASGAQHRQRPADHRAALRPVARADPAAADQSDGTPAPNPTNWVHRLNLDPRFRVPAAIGASVVETNAEAYMDDAWQQIGDVLAANQRIRQLHLASRRVEQLVRSLI